MYEILCNRQKMLRSLAKICGLYQTWWFRRQLPDTHPARYGDIISIFFSKECCWNGYSWKGELVQQVLTTSWVEGEKLSESKEADVPQLVSVALNCYLIQLLESGFLHADPHPGNLLRTPDGRLCVLDFGLMIQVKLSCIPAFGKILTLLKPI